MHVACYRNVRAKQASHCQNCGKQLRQAETQRCRHCWLTHLSQVGMTQRMAAARATALKGGIRSKAELQCAELLTTLGMAFEQQIAISRFIVDFLVGNLVIEVHGSYWHARPQAVERDKRKRESLEQMGYHVLYLRTDHMHLWWRLLQSDPAP